MNNQIPAVIEQAMRAVIDGNRAYAEDLLRTLDFQRLLTDRKQLLTQLWSPLSVRSTRPRIKAKRSPVSAKLMLEVYRRDSFTCRYAHCQRKTIYIPVLKELSRLFPRLLPYHRNSGVDGRILKRFIGYSSTSTPPLMRRTTEEALKANEQIN